MSRIHGEIDRLAGRLHAADAGGGIRDDQTDDLLACLYGLHALLSLHFSVEEESYFALIRPVAELTSALP